MRFFRTKGTTTLTATTLELSARSHLEAATADLLSANSFLEKEWTSESKRKYWANTQMLHRIAEVTE